MNIIQNKKSYIAYILYLPYNFMYENSDFKVVNGNFYGPNGYGIKRTTTPPNYFRNINDMKTNGYDNAYNLLLQKIITDHSFTEI